MLRAETGEPGVGRERKRNGEFSFSLAPKKNPISKRSIAAVSAAKATIDVSNVEFEKAAAMGPACDAAARRRTFLRDTETFTGSTLHTVPCLVELSSRVMTTSCPSRDCWKGGTGRWGEWKGSGRSVEQGSRAVFSFVPVSAERRRGGNQASGRGVVCV